MGNQQGNAGNLGKNAKNAGNQGGDAGNQNGNLGVAEKTRSLGTTRVCFSVITVNDELWKPGFKIRHRDKI